MTAKTGAKPRKKRNPADLTARNEKKLDRLVKELGYRVRELERIVFADTTPVDSESPDLDESYPD